MNNTILLLILQNHFLPCDIFSLLGFAFLSRRRSCDPMGVSLLTGEDAGFLGPLLLLSCLEEDRSCDLDALFGRGASEDDAGRVLIALGTDNGVLDDISCSIFGAEIAERLCLFPIGSCAGLMGLEGLD